MLSTKSHLNNLNMATTGQHGIEYLHCRDADGSLAKPSARALTTVYKDEFYPFSKGGYVPPGHTPGPILGCAPPGAGTWNAVASKKVSNDLKELYRTAMPRNVRCALGFVLGYSNCTDRGGNDAKTRVITHPVAVDIYQLSRLKQVTTADGASYTPQSTRGARNVRSPPSSAPRPP